MFQWYLMDGMKCSVPQPNTSIYISIYIYIYPELLLYIFGNTSECIFVSISDFASVSFILSLYIQEVAGEKFHNLAIYLINSKMT